MQIPIKKNYLLLSSETIYPCNKLNNKNTNISFRADQYTLNNDNIVNIADITGELQFIDLTIDSDISSLQCNKLNIINNLSISDISDLNKFTKRLQIGNCNLNSLPDISNLECSELILGVPKNFDINTISPQTLQYLSQYQGNLVVYTIKAGKSIDLTGEIKKKIQAHQTH